MKKTFCALFLLAMTLFCFGFKSDDCDFKQKNAFRICRYVTNEGRSSISYVFPVNSAKLLEKNISEEEVSQYKFYLGSYVNAFAKNYGKRAIDGVTVESAIYYEDVDGYGFSIVFENENAQKNFFSVEGDAQDLSTTQKNFGFFVKKNSVRNCFSHFNQQR